VQARLVLDRALCRGHGRCYTLAPDVYDVGEDGLAVLRLTDVPADLLTQAELGVDNCPEMALTLEMEALETEGLEPAEGGV
jgi:ferredoxin